LYASFGVVSPFLPVWFGERGLSAAQIALVIGFGTVVRLAAVPLAGRIADRRRAWRGTLSICALGADGSIMLGGAMNPLQWRREYQLAWIVLCIVGGMAGLFFAWMESGTRMMTNYTLNVDVTWVFLLWLLHPSGYWLWSAFGIVFIGLTFYAAMLVRVRS
jgi:MFS family permease